MTETSDETSTPVPRGLLRPELFIGVASSVTARTVGVNLSEAGRPSGSHFAGGRYGRGEVGEFILIEGQQSILLGRITEVSLREAERRSLKRGYAGNSDLEALGTVQLLGCIAMDTLHVSAGVDSYSRLGDRIYAAPHEFIAALPILMDKSSADADRVRLTLGTIDGSTRSGVSVSPERLFGRHCAILGATGGGKSWTTARLIEECMKFPSKVILIDATSEYRDFSGERVVHCHLGSPVEQAPSSIISSLPANSFLESDFLALFEPAGKVQGPKLRAAIRSLRLVALQPSLGSNGVIKKHGQVKKPILDAEANPAFAARLNDPREPFDVHKLVSQIEQECVWPNGGTFNNPNAALWGQADESSFSNCLSLFTRINGAIASHALSCVFAPNGAPSITDRIDAFLKSEERLLRICLSGLSYEYSARQIVANTIGRHLLSTARSGQYQRRPALIIVDEAHNFLGKRVGTEDFAASLDSFELIAREGRKYGLSICLASQRPRDITEGVLSQMGTLIVHRITNDQDRELVERACGEIDRSAAAFLPNLRQGEAVVIGTDFPIPLTLRVNEPSTRPRSDGPSYQRAWAVSSSLDSEKP